MDSPNAIREIRKVFEDAISETSPLFLQVKNESWNGEFTDLKDTDEIPDRSVVRVVVMEQPKVLYTHVLAMMKMKSGSFRASQMETIFAGG